MLGRVHRELSKVKSQFKAPNNTAVSGKSNPRLRSLGNCIRVYIRAAQRNLRAKECPVYKRSTRGSVGAKSQGRELYSLAEANCTSKRMDTGDALAVLGKKRKGPDGYFPTQHIL